MKYTKVANDAFEHIQTNAGIMVDSFNPNTQEIGNILCATNGGFNFVTNPEFADRGEGIDNVPLNTKELKQLTSVSPVLTTTAKTVTGEFAKRLATAADMEVENLLSRIVPRAYLDSTDFKDVWIVADYSNVNEGIYAGFVAIHIMNSLSTGGFQIQTNNNDSGSFSVELTGHYTIEDIKKVPYEIYIQKGSKVGIVLDKKTASVAVEGTTTLNATTVPSDATVAWTTSDEKVALVDDGEVTGVSAGTATITAKITVDEVEYTATCEVTVTA